jgi:hypothetical protein
MHQTMMAAAVQELGLLKHSGLSALYGLAFLSQYLPILPPKLMVNPARNQLSMSQSPIMTITCFKTCCLRDVHHDDIWLLETLYCKNPTLTILQILVIHMKNPTHDAF